MSTLKNKNVPVAMSKEQQLDRIIRVDHAGEYGAVIVSVAGFSPIPYKVFTIASGVTNLDLTTFIIASAVSRSARFFLVAALLWKYGTPIREFIEKHLAKLSLLFCIILVGMFVLLKYI